MKMDSASESPFSIVFKRLRERKDNVAVHLRGVRERVASLRSAEDSITSEYLAVCQRVENEVSVVVESLKRRKLVYLQELEADMERKMSDVAESLQFANMTLLKAEEVSCVRCYG